MNEKKLKQGDSVEYEIGAEKLILTPMPWGKFKKVLKLITESWATYNNDLANDNTKFMTWLTTLIETRLDELFPLIIDENKNTFFNKEWVDDNVTLGHVQQIITDAIAINGVKDFLGLLGRKGNPSQNQVQEKVEEPATI